MGWITSGLAHVITKDLSKGFFSLRSTESGKEVRRIHGAHLKQYVTPPNSPQNEPVSIDDQESSSESPNLSIDSPPLFPYHLMLTYQKTKL